MPPPWKRWAFWAPRVLSITFALFISLFALDVFEGGGGVGEKILGFVIHLVPTAVLVALLVLAWRWEWVGVVVFPALGVLYLILFRGRFDWSVYLVIAGPLFLVGILFLVSRLSREGSRPGA